MWDARVARWPSAEEWATVVLTTLQALRSAGATVAWFGLEGFFVDPPLLFDPNVMSGGVWAALDEDGILYGPPPLNGRFEPLSDTVLTNLRRCVAPLAAAPDAP